MEIFQLLNDGVRAGQGGVLATITELVGPGPRSLGSHMAVTEEGRSAGSFSSGCVETAIIAEALDVLKDGKPKTVRFGLGSPYFDIRLPCGGGMDILFQPHPDGATIRQLVSRLEGREKVLLKLDPAGSVELAFEAKASSAAWINGRFYVPHFPQLRLMLVGHGAEMLTTLKLAVSLGLSINLFSPDPDIVGVGRAEGIECRLLKTPDSPVNLQGDPWTAFLFLFHDHDWEPPLIAGALAAQSFWVGAMGSPRTHQARREALAAFGVPSNQIARIKGPVGLIPNTRDPATLALSALAEIVGTYRDLNK